MPIARLRRDPGSFDAVRTAFHARNAGYTLDWLPEQPSIGADRDSAVFVQRGRTEARVAQAAATLDVGDVVLLRGNETLECATAIDVLRIGIPEPFDRGLPTFIRPDHDANLTDTPGGCATESDAYRRVLLTWLDENGPYNCRALNIHRVRMTDSFSHYHPIDGGFDELYLVQHARPGARVITSDRVARIEASDEIEAAELASLLDETELEIGDLFYAERGTMHRGVGGVLAHVITVPGFVPGSEIGVDHHLRRINERFELTGPEALPYCAAAAAAPVVR